MKSLEQIYKEAETFVKSKWSNLRPNEERITVLAIIKALVDLEQMKNTREMFDLGIEYSKKMMNCNDSPPMMPTIPRIDVET